MSEEIDAVRVWFRLLRQQTRLRLAITARLRALDLSVPQCDVLTTLTEREGVSQQELAGRLYVTKGNISGLIDRLAAAGLVERRSPEGDRRSHAVYLTAEGRKMAQKGIDIQRAFVMETFGRMSAERLALYESLLIETRELTRAAQPSPESAEI